MASVCARNNIVAVYNENGVIVANTDTKLCKHLDLNEKNVIKFTDENYFGLRRFCSALSPSGTVYAFVTEMDKKLRLHDTQTWLEISARSVERGASRITFTPSGNHVILADKTGDVYRFSTSDPEEAGDLLSGHLSMLLDVVVSQDEKFLVTCDRDEKIRISYYPNAYNIHSFCLGHVGFVTKVALYEDGLISTSGDGTLRFWTLNGLELAVCNIAKGEVVTNLQILCGEEAALTIYNRDSILIYGLKDKNLKDEISVPEPLDLDYDGGKLFCISRDRLRVFSKIEEKFRESHPDIGELLNQHVKMTNKPQEVSILFKRHGMTETECVKKMRTKE